MTWHLWIDPTPRPGWANMAIDTALLGRADQHEEGWLRLYGWEPHCLSFGRHEPATRRYDTGRIAAMKLDVVRRPTGGRAVWHAGELTYAVAAPDVWLGSLRDAYLAIHEVLRLALQAIGVEASLAPATRAAGVGAGACFAQPAGGEVMVDGRKVIGSAQLRQGTALLQHGSILLEHDQAMIREVTRGSGPPDLAAPLRSLLPEPVSRNEICVAVARSAAAAWPGDWKNVADPANVLDESAHHADRYRSLEWTWSR